MTLNVSKYSCGGENTIQYLEHVVVIIQARFDRRGYLEGYLTSPRGTTSQILPYRANDVIATDFNNWPMLSLQFWGENPEGTWNLRFRNHFPAHGFQVRGLYWFLSTIAGNITTNFWQPLQHRDVAVNGAKYRTLVLRPPPPPPPLSLNAAQKRKVMKVFATWTTLG